MSPLHLKPAALDKASAAAFVSIGVTTLEKLEREGNFPRARHLGGRRVAYLVRELEEWVESRPVSDLLPPANTGAPKPARKARSASAHPAA